MAPAVTGVWLYCMACVVCDQLQCCSQCDGVVWRVFLKTLLYLGKLPTRIVWCVLQWRPEHICLYVSSVERKNNRSGKINHSPSPAPPHPLSSMLQLTSTNQPTKFTTLKRRGAGENIWERLPAKLSLNILLRLYFPPTVISEDSCVLSIAPWRRVRANTLSRNSRLS